MLGKRKRITSLSKCCRLFGSLFLLVCILMAGMPWTALAEGGDGTGPTVDGVFKPLGLTSVTLADGTNAIDNQNVPLSPKFTFHFDKNVVYLIYWERNKGCFHLYNDETGKELSINVTKIDDTVDFSKRQYIWVEPASSLEAGTHYRLYVEPQLLAKNGGSTLASTTDNQGSTIRFKTGGTKAVSSGAAPVTSNNPQSSSSVSSSKSGTDGGSSSAVQGNETSSGAQASDGNNAPASGNQGTATEQPSDQENKDKDASGDTELAQSGDTSSSSTDPVANEGYKPSLQSIIAKYVAWVSLAVIIGWIIFEAVRRRKKADQGVAK